MRHHGVKTLRLVIKNLNMQSRFAVDFFNQVIERDSLFRANRNIFVSVSYTHLDVYKRQGLAVLRMDAETTSWEDVFLELTGDEPEAGEEETSGRADEDEDGTAAQAALEMAGDAPEEIASEEESTAHAHQPENGEEERK